MLTVKSPFNWSLMTPSTELRLGSKDFAFFSFSNALELGSTLSGLKRTNDNWSQILMIYSMEEVPETISSIVSSEYRLRGLLYFGTLTWNFNLISFTECWNYSANKKDCILYPYFSDCCEEGDLEPWVETSLHGLLIITHSVLFSHL